MARYEPKRNAEPFVKPGGTLKLRRAADGTLKPVIVTSDPKPAEMHDEPDAPKPPQGDDEA